MSKPSENQYWILVASIFIYSIVAGYVAGIQPIGQWRLFSLHPFLMTAGMIGHFGIGAITKKMGGYRNTKNHGLIGWGGIICSFLGIYAIYRNKENNGFPHLKSNHALIGIGLLASSVGLGLAGGIILHPDFGIDKTNQTFRFAHKTASRITLAIAWANAFYGLYQMNVSQLVLIAYGLPLLLFAPYILI